MKLHILPSVFGKNREKSEPVASSWQWNSCAAPGKTLSSRYDAAAAAAPGEGMFKTANSGYQDPSSEGAGTPESWFTHSASESADFSTESDDERIIITGVRSDRLFFDRSGTSSAIQENPKKQRPEKEEQGKNRAGKKPGVSPAPFEKGVAVAMDSGDPYSDFKKSMEEMVASNGIESLQELLGWYLKMNEKENHGYIVRAFMDLLIGISSSSSSCSSSISANSADLVRTSYSSAVSCLSSPPASSLSSAEER
ncbi:unnamed protein product [Cuscuta campestris]|uniref:Transcription repressor n=1 Tax=Cuscuta campestris TaxID=132261 RepID=A0A484KHF2_9ASTE|nr:unnamed protein product [Cuscuta campestris]